VGGVVISIHSALEMVRLFYGRYPGATILLCSPISSGLLQEKIRLTDAVLIMSVLAFFSWLKTIYL
jgi:hypothetical protein